MIKIYLNVEGMMCSMCEAHINDIVRKNSNVKKVKSNRKKNETIIIKNDDSDIEKIIDEINKSGYKCSFKSKEEA